MTIPDGVTILENNALDSCTGLTSVTIGKNIQTVGSELFRNCTNCSVFDFRRATVVPTLTGVAAFTNTPSNKEIIVPDELYDDWIAA